MTTLALETWRAVPEWPEYEVSDIGRVRRATPSNGTTVGKVLSPFVRGNGYSQVILHQHGRRARKLVHRLVIEAFCSGPFDGLEVAHLNGIRSDNRPENLRWVTHIENESHKTAHGTLRVGSAVGNAILDEEQVVRIRERLRSGYTQTELARKHCVSISTINLIANNKTWRHI